MDIPRTRPISQKSPKNLEWWKKISWQYLIVQRKASWLVGKLTRVRWPILKNWQIRAFIHHYQVNMQEALLEDYRAYPTFNDFFTRPLKAKSRPLDPHKTGIISPADGIVSEFGAIDNHTLIQAKGKTFTTQALLGETPSQSPSLFKKGYFATVYLAPKNYHRIHMPLKGTLTSMRFIPGKLFSVSTYTAQHIDNLFGRNERLVCFFDTELGPMAIVLVGALLVSSITTKWAGTVGSKTGQIEQVDYSKTPLIFEKGEVLGHFNMGSTVVMLMGEALSNFHWQKDMTQNKSIKMGELLAHF